MLRNLHRTAMRARCLVILSAFMAPALFTACARPPASLSGAFQEITVEDAQQRDLTGQRVRWGGTIVSVTPSQHDTCFEIVGRPLDREARPRWTDQTSGRFLACAQGFYDPAVYGARREATVVGTLQPSVVRKIGDYDYRYPQVRVERLHLWPERALREVYYTPWPYTFWYGWWGPYGPYGPRFYDPFWDPWLWSPPVARRVPPPPR